MKLPAASRRTFIVSGGAGVGLVVAFLAWPKREGSTLRPDKDESVFGPFLRVGIDSRVTLAVPQTETGQGIWTGLAQLAADELGAAWETMAVEPAPHGMAYQNRLAADEFGVGTRITAGSSSIRAFERPIRLAAAVARELLCAAAAERWGVRAAECDIAGGLIIHEGKRVAVGEVAAEAARRKPPNEPQLRDAGSGRLAGESLPRLDLPAKSDGSLRFASDVRLPRMLHASVRLAPPGGMLLGFEGSQAASQQDPAALVEGRGWLAAVGQTWWAADQALERAAARFSGPDIRDIEGRLAARLESGAVETVFERGDYAEATRGSVPLGASYAIAPTPHRPLEAPSALARFAGERLELWVGTQLPDLVRGAAAKAAGIGEDRVTLYPLPLGDGSGSGFEMQAAEIAVALAKKMGRPVSLAYPPATAQNQDPCRPPMLAKMSALPSPDGSLRSWRAILVGQAGLEASLARATGAHAPAFRANGAVPPYAIPAMRIDAMDARIPIRTGYMRGGDEAMICFATESFIDELARAMGSEPLAFRVSLLGGAPRLARALMSAARIGGWDGGGRGSGMGLACASLFGSHIGLLAEASLGPDQRISVSRLVAAVDAGRIVNPGLVRQQVEGALLTALSAASIGAPDYVAAMPRAVTIAGRGFERLDNVPAIEVEIIRSDEEPGGVSGLGMAVLAPAVANAIHAGTGRRLRNLPFDPMSSA